MSLRPLLTGILFSAAAFFPVEGLAAENNDAPQASGTQESTAAPISTQPPKLALPGFGTPAGDDTSTQTDAAIAPITPVTGEAPQPTSRDVLAETAMAYGTFQQDVTDFNRELTSSDEIEAAATVLGTHNPERLSAGWLAYSALLASESEEFAREVRKTDAHYGRDRMMLGFRNSPTYALQLDGSDDALGRALRASRADADRLERVGENIKQQAYSMQKYGWAKATLRGDSEARAESLKFAAVAGRPVAGTVETLFAGPQLTSFLEDANRLGADSSFWDSMNAPPSPEGLQLPVLSATGFSTYSLQRLRYNDERRLTAGRIATLAAYRILDETDDYDTQIAETIEDQQSRDCFETAQQIFRQCVSASHKVYERPFCIGEHALKDVGECVAEVSER